MVSDADLRKAFGRYLQEIEADGLIKAKLGLGPEYLPSSVNVGSTGLKNITFTNGEQGTTFGIVDDSQNALPVVAGMAVEVKKVKGKRYFLPFAPDGEANRRDYPGRAGDSVTEAGFGGANMLLVDQGQIKQGRVYWSGAGLVVNVDEWRGAVNGTRYEVNTTYDFASHVPSSGRQVFYLYVNTSGALAAEAGTTHPVSSDGSGVLDYASLSAPVGSVLCWVSLFVGQTAFVSDNDIHPYHEVYGGGSSSGSGSGDEALYLVLVGL